MDKESGSLANVINDFFLKEKLSPENLIDIKYSTDYDSDSGEEIAESALIIYLEEYNASKTKKW